MSPALWKEKCKLLPSCGREQRGWPFTEGWEEAVHPNLGEYWGDSLEGAVGPLVGYFLCRGVEGGGGPTIISILAA